MLLIGIKNITSSTGNTEDNLGHVTHQRIDILAEGDAETLQNLYKEKVRKGEKSKKELVTLMDNLEFSDISEDEYEETESRLAAEVSILRYERVLVVEGFVLK
jgi:hypothetical protein